MPDLERGTLRGPPLSLVSTTDSRWRRSGHQLWDGPPMSPPEVHNYWPTIGQAMTCSHRWGSSSNGLPLRSRAQDPGQARGRHDEGEASGFPHEAHHGRTTDEPLAPADKTPAQRVHDEVGKVHDVGTGLPALAHTGAWVGARRAAKHQPRGFMVEPTGVRDDRKAWAIAWLRPMNRYAAIPSDRSPSPSVRRASAEPTAAERRPECPAVPCLDRRGNAEHSPSPTWWGRHMACPQRQRADGIASAGSPCLRHGCVITASPPRAKGEALQRAHRAHHPIAVRSNHEPLMTLALGVHDAESKIDEQVSCSWRRCRWPRGGPVSEDLSGSLRWLIGSGR
jgi:hypothetical protein